MVSCAKFKSEVFACLMISIIGLALFMASVITNQWVKGTAAPVGPDAGKGMISVNYGLFSGSKEITRDSLKVWDLKVVCSAGVCMFSCGGEDDILDVLLGDEAKEDTSKGDFVYCNQSSGRSAQTSSQEDASDVDQAGRMLHYGVWVSTLTFLFTGFIFSILNIALTVLNTAHNPVGSLFGIDGLVIWNLTSFLCYLIVLILWGAEFNARLSENLCISQTLRTRGVQWSSEGTSSLGFSYWLMFPNMLVHLANAIILGYRQYRRYYAPESKQLKNLQIRVQETNDGKEMLF